jgi:benzoate-CoA ligase family protein
VAEEPERFRAAAVPVTDGSPQPRAWRAEARAASEGRLTIPARFNITAALLERRLTAGDGERIAVEIADQRWTYRDIAQLTARVGNSLRTLGVAREQRVVIILPDSTEFIAAFLGTMLVGAVAVPCSTFLGPSDYAYFLRDARAPVLITTSELLERLDLSVAPDLAHIILTDRTEDDGRMRSWARLIEGASPSCVPADTHKDDPAFWLWTSGSTGEPKGAVHLHQDAPWCCELVSVGVYGMSPADRAYSAAKLFHAYGLCNGMFFPFWTGGTTILHPGRSTHNAVYSIIDRARPTIFFGVPTLYAVLLQVADAEQRFNLSSLRFCVSAGEPLPAELYRRWLARFGTEILDGIGSTELLNMYICSRPGLVRPGSSGLVIDGYGMKIVDEYGESVGPNQVGDLLVSGPSCAIMYWDRREETKQKMLGEWFVSGDKYVVDDDGYYWFKGRSDDMFKASGEWISPIEIESLLVEHAAVVECAVVAWQETIGVVRPKAFVVLAEGAAANDAMVLELQTFIRSRAAHYKCPRAIEFVTELPKTATGKLQRFKLRGIVR